MVMERKGGLQLTMVLELQIRIRTVELTTESKVGEEEQHTFSEC